MQRRALYAGDPRWQLALPLLDQRRGQRRRGHLAHGGRRGVPDGLASGQHRGARQGAAHAHAALPRADAGVEGRYRHGHRAWQHRDHRHGCRARAGRHANLCERYGRAADWRAQAGARSGYAPRGARICRRASGHSGNERLLYWTVGRGAGAFPGDGHSVAGCGKRAGHCRAHGTCDA